MSYSITPPIIPSLRDTCPVVLVDQAQACAIRHTSNRYRTVHTRIFLGNFLFTGKGGKMHNITGLTKYCRLWLSTLKTVSVPSVQHLDVTTGP
jgi:hypothetical protein